ncbi:MAG TPA: Uma2 family endonuclease [Pirellulales bacterium]
MATMVLDRFVEQEILARRRECGGDRFDEVWEGVYMMSPLVDNEHQEIAMRLGAALRNALGWKSPFLICPGVNVSDREDQWEHNYRCPDVVVFAPDTKAKNLGTHWCGGPDFTVEITSPADRTREKFDFYAQVGVRELLIVDRSPWKLELYKLTSGQLRLEGTSALADGNRLISELLGVTLRLVAGPARPMIEVAHAATGQSWLV